MAKVIKREEGLVKFEFEVSVEDFQKATVNVYNRTKNKFRVPGFRKGKATKGIIERHYGEGVFYEDALNEVLPSAIDSAINELGIKLAARADINIKELDPKNKIVIEASAPERPEFELGDYKGVEIEIPSSKVTEEEIDAHINQELSKNARIVEVEDRAIEPMDTVIIDFVGTIDGKEFDGSSATNYSLKIGSKSFIEGFEEGLIGKNKGEVVDINVTFPEDYNAKELAGKDAVFNVTIHEIKEEKLPELDDDFVMDISEFDTVAEYKDSIKEKLEKQKKDSEEGVKKNAALKHLSDITVVDIHERTIDEEVDTMLREFEQNLSRSGLDIKTYMQFTGSSVEELKEEMKATAENRVKNEYILEKLIDVEKIEISKDELETELKKVADARSLDVEKIRSIYEVDDYKYFKELIAKDKAVDFLVENAVFKEEK